MTAAVLQLAAKVATAMVAELAEEGIAEAELPDVDGRSFRHAYASAYASIYVENEAKDWHDAQSKELLGPPPATPEDVVARCPALLLAADPVTKIALALWVKHRSQAMSDSMSRNMFRPTPKARFGDLRQPPTTTAKGN